MRGGRVLRCASLMMVGVAACEPSVGEREGGTVVRDSLGVTIVENPVLSDSVFMVSEDLRIGSVEGEGPDLFSAVVKVGVSAAGDVFVADGGSASVRVFDAEGRFVRQFGSRGDGPGEVNYLNDLLVVGDTVLLIDWQGGGKAVRFGTDGDFVTSIALRQPDGRYLLPAGHDGVSWLANYDPPFERVVLDFGEPLERRNLVHRYDWDTGEIGDQVYSRVAMTVYGTQAGEAGTDWGLFGRASGGDPYDGAGRMHSVSADDYVIRVHGPRGLERIVRREVERVPVTAELIAEVRAAAVAVMDTIGTMDPGRRREQVEQVGARIDLWATLPHPEFVPPIDRLLVGPDGDLWVSRRDGPDRAVLEGEAMFRGSDDVPIRPVTWDLHAPDGRLRGTIVTPPHVRIDEISRDHAWGLLIGDFDVPYVVRYSLRPQAAG